MAISLWKGKNKAEKLLGFFSSTAVLHGCGGKQGGSSPVDMGSPPGTSMVARSHDLLVFLHLTHDLSLLDVTPFACETGGTGHG